VIGITGGTGFIGRRLTAAHLACGDDVRVLTRRPQAASAAGAMPCVADLASARAGELARFVDGIDVLYHCAGELRDRSRMEPVHVGGTRALLDAAAGRVRRWVQLSSVGVYGVQRSGTVTEDAPLQPVGLYELTKARADEVVLERAQRGVLEAVVLRPSIVIGSGMPSRSLWRMLAAVERGLFFFVGPRGASANYVPVDEVSYALQLAANAPGGAARRVYNLSHWLTIEDFVAAMARVIGTQAPTRRVPEWFARIMGATLGRIPAFPLTPNRVDALTSFVRFPSDRLAAELGYVPRRTISDALADVVREWKAARQARSQ
jgi:nucleoside-diphosphate-sugar epimerase